MAAEDEKVRLLGDLAVGCPSPSGRPTPAGIEAVLPGLRDLFQTTKKDVKPGEREGEIDIYTEREIVSLPLADI